MTDIFTETDLIALGATHPSYLSVAEAINKTTNNVAFADDMITVLQAFVIDRKERDAETFRLLMRG